LYPKAVRATHRFFSAGPGDPDLQDANPAGTPLLALYVTGLISPADSRAASSGERNIATETLCPAVGRLKPEPTASERKTAILNDAEQIQVLPQKS